MNVFSHSDGGQFEVPRIGWYTVFDLSGFVQIPRFLSQPDSFYVSSEN